MFNVFKSIGTFLDLKLFRLVSQIRAIKTRTRIHEDNMIQQGV